MDGLGEVVVEGLGELIGGLALGGGSSRDEKSGCGCFIIILIVLIAIGIFVYIEHQDKEHSVKTSIEYTKVRIDGMYNNDQVGVHTSKGDTLITISHDLYLNKKVGDSINLQIK